MTSKKEQTRKYHRPTVARGMDAAPKPKVLLPFSWLSSQTFGYASMKVVLIFAGLWIVPLLTLLLWGLLRDTDISRTLLIVLTVLFPIALLLLLLFIFLSYRHFFKKRKAFYENGGYEIGHILSFNPEKNRFLCDFNGENVYWKITCESYEFRQKYNVPENGFEKFFKISRRDLHPEEYKIAREKEHRKIQSLLIGREIVYYRNRRGKIKIYYIQPITPEEMKKADEEFR